MYCEGAVVVLVVLVALRAAAVSPAFSCDTL